MKERPMLFSAPMVKAILDGRKTQTRRVMKPKPEFFDKGEGINSNWFVEWCHPKTGCLIGEWGESEAAPAEVIGCCPYGQPGDRLWVRESFQLAKATGSVGDEWVGDELLEWEGPLPKTKPGVNTFPAGMGFEWEVYYKADKEPAPVHWWRPSIFMPRWASRVTLKIVNVRVERLQDISKDDAKAEGVSNIWKWDKARNAEHPEHFVRGVLNPYIANYSVLWDEINGKGAWVLNPWVWVIEFKKLEVENAK